MSLLKKLTLATARRRADARHGRAGAMADNIKIALLVKYARQRLLRCRQQGRPGSGQGTRRRRHHLHRPDHRRRPKARSTSSTQLIAQKVNAIAISANDADALVPALKQAMERGITVISFDSGVAKDGRQMQPQLASATDLIGDQNLKMAADLLNGQKGDVADPVGDLDRDQPERLDRRDEEGRAASIPNVNLTTVVYGDDKQDKSYTEAKGLIDVRPEPQGRSSPRPPSASPPRRRYVEDDEARRQGLRHRPRPAVRDDQPRQVGAARRSSRCGTRSTSATPP